jgi:hypothetical protein
MIRTDAALMPNSSGVSKRASSIMPGTKISCFKVSRNTPQATPTFAVLP